MKSHDFLPYVLVTGVVLLFAGNFYQARDNYNKDQIALEKERQLRWWIAYVIALKVRYAGEQEAYRAVHWNDNTEEVEKKVLEILAVPYPDDLPTEGWKVQQDWEIGQQDLKRYWRLKSPRNGCP
jgi:hypothetical protein